MKRKIFKLILGNLIVFLSILLIIELTLRIRGHKTYPGNPPDIVVKPDGKYFQKDSLLGYKHRTGKFQVTLKGEYDFITQHDSATHRLTGSAAESGMSPKPEIWVFGCSFTHGWSINDAETFPWKLQANLSDFKVINWGVTGYGTIHFYLQLRQALMKRDKPGMVIINHADFHHDRNVLSFQKKRSSLRWNFPENLSQPYCIIDENGELNILYSNIESKSWKLSEHSALANYCEVKYKSYLDRKNQGKRKAITEQLLDEIISLCKENDVKIILSNINGNSEFLHKISLTHKVPFIDISVDLTENGYSNYPYDGHPSSKSNSIYADRIISFLRDSIISDNR